MEAWKPVLGGNCSNPSEKWYALHKVTRQSGWRKLGSRDKNPNVHSSTIYNSQDMEAT